MYDRDDDYDDLLEIVETLGGLIYDLKCKDRKKEIEDILDSYKDELQEIENQYETEATEELRRREREYWSDQF